MIVPNMEQFHIVVTERDGYVCQYQISKKCRKTYAAGHFFDPETGKNQYVCGHHVKTQKSRPDLKLETDNGKTVCYFCHELLHRGKRFDFPFGK